MSMTNSNVTGMHVNAHTNVMGDANTYVLGKTNDGRESEEYENQNSEHLSDFDFEL